MKEKDKKLIWRLKALPTADEISQLVEAKVITAEEARDLIFREDTKDTTEIEALKEMVHTLQDLVKELINKQGVQIIPYTKVIEVPARTYPIWQQELRDGFNLVAAGYPSTQYTLSVN